MYYYFIMWLYRQQTSCKSVLYIYKSNSLNTEFIFVIFTNISTARNNIFQKQKNFSPVR